ncbi:MAG TPA: VOC family protein, partial [Acidobacteriota bacterium]|nr:VOC family protein [Acidobacteriota bacterium]
MHFDQIPRPVDQTVDHLLLGAADLESGIEWVENLTGVRALPGGSHPGVGTRNALLSLGRQQYLEIIAPDPAQPAFNFRIDLRALTTPRFISWAAATEDLEFIRKRGLEAGYRIDGPEEGTRQRPDGRLLRWVM